MHDVVFKIDTPQQFSDSEKKRFVDLLILQNKVINPNIKRLNRCPLLCACIIDNLIVSIGAIKPKTINDFNVDKANVIDLGNSISFELGYFFTLPNHTKKGYSSVIAQKLVAKSQDLNLMATTEWRDDNPMLKILKKNNFIRFGKSWKSAIHKGELGLFLRMKNDFEYKNT